MGLLSIPWHVVVAAVVVGGAVTATLCRSFAPEFGVVGLSDRRPELVATGGAVLATTLWMPATDLVGRLGLLVGPFRLPVLLAAPLGAVLAGVVAGFNLAFLLAPPAERSLSR